MLKFKLMLAQNVGGLIFIVSIAWSRRNDHMGTVKNGDHSV